MKIQNMSGSRKFPPGEHNNWGGGGVRGIILFSRYGRGSEAHFREFHYDFNKFEFSGRGSDPPPLTPPGRFVHTKFMNSTC